MEGPVESGPVRKSGACQGKCFQDETRGSKVASADAVRQRGTAQEPTYDVTPAKLKLRHNFIHLQGGVALRAERGFIQAGRRPREQTEGEFADTADGACALVATFRTVCTGLG
jgi:hypothetical protein